MSRSLFFTNYNFCDASESTNDPNNDKFWSVTSNFFFFQAEDGIRDIGVTGVQTCALPISTVEITTSNKVTRTCANIINNTANGALTSGIIAFN